MDSMECRLSKFKNDIANQFGHNVFYNNVLIGVFYYLLEKRINTRILFLMTTYRRVLATLTFKVLKFQQPAYIYDLIAPYIPPRSLRSFNKNLLIVPDIRSEMGRRSFSFASPSILNSLPQHIRFSDSLSAFRGLLKTFLYQKSLPP